MLDLECCDLFNVDCLKNLFNLYELNLSINYGINIHPIQYLKKLTKLNLEACALIDITYLKPLVNLEELIIPNNNIVYLEPLKDLKQIKVLSAELNQIFDAQVLSDHPNFSSYYLDYQNEPGEYYIADANKLRDINAQIPTLRQISKMNSRLKYKLDLQYRNINQCFQHIFSNQIQFVSKVASLFQQLSSSQDFQ
ncbi:leucine-rich_repeat domain-containing protein [Hexamita inflata]|uniref:Leucine-rich repeat domain-containing protein n=1 Tax=Hexamita inflata TaxID=28002 RepID=A0AA86TSG6_9EUKA|nr:leucine-rich repeat domain-containing protein [Hexamita inflata]